MSTSAKIVVNTLLEVEEPKILQPLVEKIEAQEGESVHFECRIAPINDPILRVEWLRNDELLPDANRFIQNFEFGFVTLDILYTYPEDNGKFFIFK